MTAGVVRDLTPYSREGRQIQEGGQRLHLPNEGTHRYRLPIHEEQDERHNEVTPAGKARPELVARGKLHGEVSSSETTHNETKTEEVRNPLPQTSLRPVFWSKNFSDKIMNREYFLKYSQTCGPFDLDGTSGACRRRSGGGPGGGCARIPVGIPSPPRGGRWKPRSRAMLGTVGG
jgi:hypothetical protein